MGSSSSALYPDPYGFKPWCCKTCGVRLQATHGIGPPKTFRFEPRLSNTLPPSLITFDHRLLCPKCLKYDTNMIPQLNLQQLCMKCNYELNSSMSDYYGLKSLANKTPPTLPPCVLSSCGRPAARSNGLCEEHCREIPIRVAMYEQQKGSLKTGGSNVPPWAINHGSKDSSPNIGNLFPREKAPHKFGHTGLNAGLDERAKTTHRGTPLSKRYPLQSGSSQRIYIDPTLLREKATHHFEDDGLNASRYQRAKTTRRETQPSKPHPPHSGSFQKINVDPSLLRKLRHSKRYQQPGFTQDSHLPRKYI